MKYRYFMEIVGIDRDYVDQLAILVGCKECGERARFSFRENGRAWIRFHNYHMHNQTRFLTDVINVFPERYMQYGKQLLK